MANIYVRNAGSGTSPFDTWAKAATTLSAALATATSSDTIWVADDHSESTAGSLTLTHPASPGLRVLCANTHLTEPPTGLATTAAIATTSTSTITFAGCAYVYGLQVTSSSSTTNGTISLGQGTGDQAFIFDHCSFILGGSSTAARLNLGTSGSGSNKSVSVKLWSCSAKFASTSQSFTLNYGRLYCKVLSIDGAGSVPTTLFRVGVNGICGDLLVEASDLSGVAFTNLVDQSTDSTFDLTLRDCKLPASISTTTGAVSNVGGCHVRVDSCDSGATTYTVYRGAYSGSMVNETTIVRSSGASDGTTSLSWKIVTNASASYPSAPFQSNEIVQWNDTTGASKTATVEFVHDSVTALTNAEIWMDLLYLGSSATPLGTIGSCAVADVTTTAASQPSSTVTWTTTGITNVKKQKLQVTFTPQMKGPVIARLYVAKASYTVYVDPVITIA